jgi:F-type H+-transporting ATPase subunit delta
VPVRLLGVVSRREAKTPVASASSSVFGVVGRYANALYDLASETGVVDAVSADLETVSAALAASEDFARMVKSPVLSVEAQSGALGAVGTRMKLSATTLNFLKLVAKNRRLAALPEMITGYKTIVAERRGLLTADVTSAVELKPAQLKALQAALKDSMGKDVIVNASVDQSLIGGLVVKVGSRMIDSSLRTKLSSLKIALKEVG